MEFGKIVEVPLRDVWAGEATHFTPWLAANLERVSTALGLELELESTEVNAGDFSADIVAKDVATNRRVIIENQYGGTDHRHFGQILTYSSVLNANVVIWIAEKIRPEHKAAMDFLNLNLKESLQIFAVEANIIRIDDSKPAFGLKVVCMPTEAASVSASATADATETQEKYRVYYQALLDELRNVYKFTNARAAQPQNWYTFSSDNSKFYRYSTAFAQGGRVRVETYIDSGDKGRNEAIFDFLYAQKDAINVAYGRELDWDKLPTKRACRIAAYRDGDIDADSEELVEIRRWVVENLLRMRQVLPQFLENAIGAAAATAYAQA
ncbi:MAG: DUF4268 domain-containing protein [Gammaproteobacteria bacterium]|uniref:DUF4268 domain-containing protein n=1 Tax=uncultured Pseudacidovorax sp. TaxID=679313 RepID=UPI0025DC2665|nr:DUF4268 domain-containing protein [uncultured Pseudacidovorax sp.]